MFALNGIELVKPRRRHLHLLQSEQRKEPSNLAKQRVQHHRLPLHRDPSCVDAWEAGSCLAKPQVEVGAASNKVGKVASSEAEEVEVACLAAVVEQEEGCQQHQAGQEE